MNDSFRPKSNFVWAGVSFALLVLFVANGFLVVGFNAQTIVELLISCVLGSISYLFWIKPKMMLNTDGVVVVNPITTTLIPYGDILSLETKWTLTIIHKRGKTRVWVAPASGKRRWIANETFGMFGRGILTADNKNKESTVMSESLDSLSGQAAYLIREKMKRLH